jgi:hypothetical protein
MQDEIVAYVVYRDPSDYPGMFVLRAFRFQNGRLQPELDPKAISKSLSLCRALIPKDRVNLERSANDDSAIYEVWI